MDEHKYFDLEKNVIIGNMKGHLKGFFLLMPLDSIYLESIPLWNSIYFVFSYWSILVIFVSYFF